VLSIGKPQQKSVTFSPRENIVMTSTNNTQQQSRSSMGQDFIPISQNDIDKIQEARALQQEFYNSSIKNNYDIRPTAQEMTYHSRGIEEKHRNALSYASAHLGNQIDFTDPKHRVFLAASLVAQSLENFKDLDYDFRARISIANALTYSRLSKQQRDVFIKTALTAASAGTGLAAVWAKHPYVSIPAGSAAIILQAFAANKSITLAQLNKAEAEDLFQPVIIKEKNINTLNSLRKTISHVKLSSEARQHLINLVQDQQIKQLTNKVATSRADHSGSSSQDATDKLTHQRAAAAQLQRDYLTDIDSDSPRLSSMSVISNILKEIENPDVLSACQKTFDDERICVAQNKPVSPCEVNVNVFKNILDTLCSNAEGEDLSAVCQDPKIRELLKHLTQELSTQHQACDYIGELAKQSNVQNTLTTTMSNLGDDLECAVQAADSFTDLMRADSPDLNVVDLSFQQIRQSLHQAQQTMRSAEARSKKETKKANNAHMAALANVVFEQTTTIATEGFEAQAHIAQLKAELQQLKTTEPNNKMGILRKSQALKNSVDQAKAKYLKAQHVINNIGMGVDLLTGVISLVDPKAAKGIAVVAGAGLTIAGAIVAMSCTGMALAPMLLIAGAVLSVVQYFLSGPDLMEVIMQQLAKISQQIQSLREHADERFDRLENMLSALHRNIMREFVRVQGKLDRIKTTVERMRLEADRRDFEQQKDLAFSYHQAHPYVPNKDEMSKTVRRRCYSTFKAWALRGSKRPVFVGEFEDEMSAEDIITSVEAHGVENSLKLLADYATLHYDLDTKTVINPLIWSEGVRTLLSFVRCTPEFKQQSSQADGVQSMIDAGKTARDFLWRLKSSDVLFEGLFSAYRKSVESLIELIFTEMKTVEETHGFLDVTSETTTKVFKQKIDDQRSEALQVNFISRSTPSAENVFLFFREDDYTPRHKFGAKLHVGGTMCVALSPDGRQIATAGIEDHLIQIFSLADHSLYKVITRDKSVKYVNHMVFLSNNTYLVSVFLSGTAVNIWNVEQGGHVKKIKIGKYPITSLISAPRGNVFISASNNGALKVWDIEKDDCIKTIDAHKRGGVYLTLISDSQRLASTSEKGQIKIWKIDTWECLSTLNVDNPSILKILPSGNNAVAVFNDGKKKSNIKMFNMRGDIVKKIAIPSYIKGCQILSDEYILVSGTRVRSPLGAYRVLGATFLGGDFGMMHREGHQRYLVCFNTKQAFYQQAPSFYKMAFVTLPNGCNFFYHKNEAYWEEPFFRSKLTKKTRARLKEDKQIKDSLVYYLSLHVGSYYRQALQAQALASESFQEELGLIETHRKLLLTYLQVAFPVLFKYDSTFREAIAERLWGINEINALLSEKVDDPNQFSVVRIKRDLPQAIEKFEEYILTQVIQAQQCVDRENTPCHPLINDTLNLLKGYLTLLSGLKAQPKQKKKQQQSKASIQLNALTGKVVEGATAALFSQNYVQAINLYQKGIADLLKMQITLNLSKKDIAPVMARFSAGLMACVNPPVYQFNSTQSRNTQKQIKPSTRKANITKATISLNEEAVTVYDCNVKGDGACALYAMSAGVLLPVVDDDSAFKQRFTDLFGKQASSDRSEVRRLINNYRRNPDPSELCLGVFERLVNTALRTRVANYIEKNKAVKPTGSIETYAELLVNGQQDRYKNKWVKGEKKRIRLPKLDFDVMLNKLKTHWDEWAGTPAIMAVSEILQIPIHQYQYQKFKKNQPVGLTEGLEHVPQKCIKNAVPITLFFNGIDHYRVLLQPQFLELGQTSSKQHSQSIHVNSVKGTQFNPIKTNDTTYSQENAKIYGRWQ
jgi:hypothetical protein